MNVRAIPISDIDVDLAWNSRNPKDVETTSDQRSESAGIEGLIANMRSVGQTTAVDVRATSAPFYRDTAGKRCSLVTGFRRLTALSRIYTDGGTVPNILAGHVLAIDRGYLSEREAFLLNARENTNREYGGWLDRGDRPGTRAYGRHTQCA